MGLSRRLRKEKASLNYPHPQPAKQRVSSTAVKPRNLRVSQFSRNSRFDITKSIAIMGDLDFEKIRDLRTYGEGKV